jgi:hypothetical protein
MLSGEYSYSERQANTLSMTTVGKLQVAANAQMQMSSSVSTAGGVMRVGEELQP